MSSKTKTTATKEETKPALVPKLRFPAFQDAEAWEQKEVGDLFQVTRGDVLSMTLVRDEKTEAMPYPVYSSQTKNNGLSGFYSEYLFEDAITWTTDGANAGDVNYRAGKFFCTNVCGVLLSLKGFANPCIAALINSVARKYVSYVGNPKLMNGVMSKIPVPLPPLPEQQKIAECLSSVDELMATQARKVDALKTHKKGLMQQLFPREGETQPRLRFPEFQNAGEWEKTTIGALGNFYYGKSAPKWSLEDEAPTPCVRYGELYTKFGPIITETYSRTNIDPTTLRFSKGGEILVPRVGEKPEDFGKCCCYLPLKGIAIGEMISVFETEQDPLFYTYYFRHLYRQFARVVEGQNVKNLYYAVLQPLAICRPPLPEQQRIASCLSSLDALITAETQKLEALKIHKKGLMQQLFPSVGGVAGEA